MHKRFKFRTKETLLFVFFFLCFLLSQALTSLGLFVAVDHDIRESISNQYHFEAMRIWSKDLFPFVLGTFVLLSIWAKKTKFCLLFIAILIILTLWEIASKKWLGQPSGMLGCFYFACSGTSPSGHALRSLFMVGGFVMLSRWFLFLVPLVPYTFYGLVAERWHWFSDVIVGGFLAMAGIAFMLMVMASTNQQNKLH